MRWWAVYAKTFGQAETFEENATAAQWWAGLEEQAINGLFAAYFESLEKGP